MADRVESLPQNPMRALDDGHQDSESFADDAVAARKGAESQRASKRDNARDVSDALHRLNKAGQRVNESTFRRAGQNPQQRKTQTFRESGKARPEGLRTARARDRARVEELEDNLRVEEVLSELTAILQEMEEAGLDTLMKEIESDPEMVRTQAKDGLSKMTGPMASRLNQLNRMLRRLKEAEFQARMVLQSVLTGSTGLELLSDPRLTFKRLFDRLKTWPRRIPPGHRPETDEEFDLFISWVFEPPAYDEEETSF